MSRVSPSLPARKNMRQTLTVVAILALTLISAALDRRNVVYGRDTAETRAVERQDAPSTEAMLRDMLGHD